jgi:hypothetical protein
MNLRGVYQPGSNLVKDDNGKLLAVSNIIFDRQNYYYFYLLNIHMVSDVRQTKIYISEPLVPDPSPFKAVIKFQQN